MGAAATDGTAASPCRGAYTAAAAGRLRYVWTSAAVAGWLSGRGARTVLYRVARDALPGEESEPPDRAFVDDPARSRAISDELAEVGVTPPASVAVVEAGGESRTAAEAAAAAAAEEAAAEEAAEEAVLPLDPLMLATWLDDGLESFRVVEVDE